jgi:2-methylcitrate dehydratase
VDRTTERLVDFTRGFGAQDLTPDVLASARNHLVDTVAVAIAGTRAEPAGIAARIAAATRAEPGATLIGHGTGVAPDMAAFANAVMVRTYDWNDGMQAKAGGHPSDMIPGILAAGEIAHAGGGDVLVASTLAYELLGGLGAATDRRNFDQGLFMGAAVALASGTLLGLDREQLGHAASLALTTALPLGVHRWGALSMTKGASTAFAVRNGLFSALLARDGFTCAPDPFEGFYGLFEVTGEFEPRLPVLPGGPSVMEMAHQKPVPAESQVLGLLDLVPELRAWAGVEDIESVDITLSERAVRHVADPAKYDPRTRETADHSLPYMLAVALVDGGITLDSYLPERFLDPALRPLMQRIRVHPSEEFTAIRAQVDGVTRAHPVRLEVRTRDGRRRVDELRYHKGHFKDPMTREDIDVKFTEACRGVVGDEQRELLRKTWWDIDESQDIGEPLGMLAHFDPPAGGRRAGQGNQAPTEGD